MTDTTALTPIPQIDLRAGYLALKSEIDAAIGRVLDSGWYILGREVDAFEREFASYIGIRSAVGVANGTDAVELALRAVGVGPGDVVFTVSHTAVATIAAIERAGATPVLVDINAQTFTMDPQHLEDALKNAGNVAGRPKAVVAVHLYGHPADMPAILGVAHRYGLRVIEDCAQAHGASIAGRKVGLWGDAAAFSFYPTKNLGALGDGGAVATTDAAIDNELRALRQYGWKERYISSTPGVNSRLDEMQAAILRVLLPHLEAGNTRRRQVAEAYRRSLAECPILLPGERRGVRHVYHQYVIRTEHRDSLQRHLAASRISTAIHYPQPVHLQPAYRHVAIGPGGLRISETLCSTVLSLPMYPHLSDVAVERVIQEIRRWPAI